MPKHVFKISCTFSSIFIDGKYYLVMVGHYIDYFELDSLRSTTASAVIKVMKRNFARHGIPDECISDNGPQFDSYEYSRFARDYGFNTVISILQPR